MSAPYRHRMRVRFRECDMQGHVFFAEYPAFMDVALTELWRERAGGWQQMVEDGFDMVVGEVSARYRGSAQFDDEIDVVVQVVKLGDTSMTSEWWVERDGERLVEGTVRHVGIDPVTHAKKPIPAAIRDALS